MINIRSIRQIVSLFALIFIILKSEGQALKEFTVEGEFSIKIENRISVDFAKIKCIELAKVEAIRKHFGEVLIQGNSTFIKNTQSNTKIETTTIFNMIADSYVNGEWVKDLKEPRTNVEVRANEVWVTAKVTGVIRELPASKIDIKLITAKCPKETCESQDFYDGDDFYVIVKSATTGYISIFLDDPINNNSYMIFPYQSMKENSQIFIERDKEYILFDPNTTNGIPKTQIDQLTVSLTEKNIPEINKLFLIFSPSIPLNKPILQSTTQTIKDDSITMPSKMQSEEFQKWLGKIRNTNKDIQVTYSYINLNPRSK
jgi:hypothetical protein